MKIAGSVKTCLTIKNKAVKKILYNDFLRTEPWGAQMVFLYFTIHDPTLHDKLSKQA